jgi:hypothetical protein
MVLTLLAIAALIFVAGAENTFLIAIAALMTYLYPIQTILGLAFLGVTEMAGGGVQTEAHKLLPQ